jgi:hypothetical protein
MSQENVEIVRRAYARFDARGPNTEFLDQEIEWRGPREFPDLANRTSATRALSDIWTS